MQMLRKMATFALLGYAAVQLSGCTGGQNPNANAEGQTPKTKFVKASFTPPFKGLEVPYQKVKINAQAGGSFTYKTGSVITIPPNALVDANGKPIEGEVEVEYREFHNAEDLLFSGIPMAYDSAGTQNWLETGGMFEMNASQNNQSVLVKEGERINVKLASFEKTDDYQFYAFDAEKNNWSFERPAKASTENPERKAVEKELTELAAQPKPTPPAEPKRPKNKKKIFKLGLDTKEFPELATFKDVQWEVDETKTSISNEEFNGVRSEIWQDIKVAATNGGGYQLSFSNHRRKIDLPVRPVLGGKDLAKAEADFAAKMQTYQAERAKIDERIREAERKAAAVAAVFRETEISQFGMYNYDRIYHMTDAVQLQAASFMFDQKYSAAKVYMVSRKINSVINYGVNGVGKVEYGAFYFLPKDDITLFAVLPENKMAVLPRETVAQLKQRALSRSSMDGLEKLNFKVIEKEFATVAEAKAAIGLN